MTKAYNNSLLGRNISISGINTNVSGLLAATSGNFINSLQLNGIEVSLIREYVSSSGFPNIGSSGSYYIASDSSRIYQWTGSEYVEAGPGSTTVSANDPTAGLTLLHPFLLGGM